MEGVAVLEGQMRCGRVAAGGGGCSFGGTDKMVEGGGVAAGGRLECQTHLICLHQ